MRPDDILSAIGQLDEEVIADSEKKPGGRPPIRYLIIVAAAVAALTAAAVAAGLIANRSDVPSRRGTETEETSAPWKYVSESTPDSDGVDPAVTDTETLPESGPYRIPESETAPEESADLPPESETVPDATPDGGNAGGSPEVSDPPVMPGRSDTAAPQAADPGSDRDTDKTAPEPPPETERGDAPNPLPEDGTETGETGSSDPPDPGPADEPDEVFTRAMAVSVLYEISGEPEVTSACTFSDVPAGAWYSDRVSWAQSEGVVEGKTPTEFDPEGEANRAEFTTMVSRFIASSDTVVYEERDGAPADIDSVPEYAKESVRQMYRSGIVNGRENGMFYASEKITSSEADAMVERYMARSTPRITENGILEENCVTLGWVLNALYELEGSPEVAEWSPYDAFTGVEENVPDWWVNREENEFWETEVREKWYYSTLLWARENYLYSVWRDNSEYVRIDFESASISAEEFVNLVFAYTERFGIQLQKSRDYPGFDDLDGTEYDLRGVIALYEAGVLSERDGKTFGISETVRYEDAAAVIERIAEIREMPEE